MRIQTFIKKSAQLLSAKLLKFQHRLCVRFVDGREGFVSGTRETYIIANVI